MRVVKSELKKKKKEKTANGRYAPSELVKAISAVVDENKNNNNSNNNNSDNTSLAVVAQSESEAEKESLSSPSSPR